jgi:hypothetical protein
LSTQPVVTVEDSSGNTVTGATGTVTATLASGTGTLSHATATLSNGVATFSGLTITGTDGAYSLKFSWNAITTTSLGGTLWEGVAYGNGVFVAVNQTGGISDSTDGGNTWTSTYSSSNEWFAISYANGEFVAVGSPFIAAYSSNGTSWNTATLPNFLQGDAVTYGNGTWVAVGYVHGGTSWAATSTNNGQTWSAANLTSATWTAVAYGNGVFVAVNSVGGAASSTNGTTWTAESALPVTVDWLSMTYANSTFVLVGDNTSVVLISSNGTTWSQEALPSSQHWESVTYGNGEFYAVAGNTALAATSPDGVTWSTQALPTSSGWIGVTFGNGTFVGVSGDSSGAGFGASTGSSTALSATSSSIAILGPPSMLVITTQPGTTARSGVALAPQPVVTVEDASGNAVTSATGTVTASLVSGSGTVANPTSTLSAGVGTFSGLAISGAAGTYTLQFTWASLPAVTSAPIALTQACAVLLGYRSSTTQRLADPHLPVGTKVLGRVVDGSVIEANSLLTVGAHGSVAINDSRLYVPRAQDQLIFDHHIVARSNVKVTAKLGCTGSGITVRQVTFRFALPSLAVGKALAGVVTKNSKVVQTFAIRVRSSHRAILVDETQLTGRLVAEVIEAKTKRVLATAAS